MPYKQVGSVWTKKCDSCDKPCLTDYEKQVTKTFWFGEALLPI